MAASGNPISILLTRFRLDPYILTLVSTVVLAAVLPVRGPALVATEHVVDMAIAGLFFLYGARLRSRAVLDGIRRWRLHLTVLLVTFTLFPAFGLLAQFLVPALLPQQLYAGLLFLCLLPSTVQSSISFTSTAGGNVAAAVCSASLSNMLGIVLTPLLVAALMHSTGGGLSFESVLALFGQLLLPFVAGHLLRRWIGGWMERQQKALSCYDRGSILLVVYLAFSKGVDGGIWSLLDPGTLLALAGVIAVLLTVALSTVYQGSRLLGFDAGDRKTIVFCGSVKSLASGLPIASVLFPPQEVGLVILPVMLYHLLQLVVCATIAHRQASKLRPIPVTSPEPALQA